MGASGRRAPGALHRLRLRSCPSLPTPTPRPAAYPPVPAPQYWCCAAEGNLDKAAFWYQLPRPFGDMHSGGYAPWEPPGMARPGWCDSPSLTPPEREWTSYANHPCQFLGNATAAALASALS